MPQAILTRYIPESLHGPAKVKAYGSGHGPRYSPSVSVSYHADGCEGGYSAHRRAAIAFACKLKWSGNWHAQELAGGWVFTQTAPISFSVPRQ